MTKRSTVSDDDDVNLDDLDSSGPGGANGADTGSDDADDQDDDLPDGDEDPDDDADDAGDGEDGDDDQDDDAAAAGADDGTRGAPPRGGRENARVRALNESVRAERTAREALQARLDAMEARSRAPAQQTQETQEQRQARRALLSAEERMSEDMAELRQLVVTTNHQTQLTTADATDRASYDAKATSDPLYRRWSGKVEAERARLAGLGQFVAREAVLTFLLGKAALEARTAGAGKTQKAQAGRRVARQTVKPGDSRSDATQSRRGSGSSLEKRLENVSL